MQMLLLDFLDAFCRHFGNDGAILTEGRFITGHSLTNSIFDFQGELDWEDEPAVVSNLTMLAIFGIEDPVRPEVSNRRVHVVFVRNWL